MDGMLTSDTLSILFYYFYITVYSQKRTIIKMLPSKGTFKLDNLADINCPQNFMPTSLQLRTLNLWIISYSLGSNEAGMQRVEFSGQKPSGTSWCLTTRTVRDTIFSFTRVVLLFVSLFVPQVTSPQGGRWTYLTVQYLDCPVRFQPVVMELFCDIRREFLLLWRAFFKISLFTATVLLTQLLSSVYIQYYWY